MLKTPLLTVVIPIYNIESYLTQAIESVIIQTIGFEKNIELLLINDGSSDNSEKVCQSYKDKYPENITYILTENKGVSSARNYGLDTAKGKYIHFFDGDDILSKNYYEKSVESLENHLGIDLVASKIKFFDENIDSHPLNYKFKKDRIIDLVIEPNNPLLHVITCIFKRESLGEVRFDERLTIAEDITFIGDVLLSNPQFGALREPTYYYRKRSTGGSAISGKEHNKDYYLKTPKLAYSHILKTWESSKSRSMDFTILYDLSYRLSQSSQSVLSDDEQQDYVRTIHNIVSQLSDESILSQDYISIQQKMYILKIKHQSISDHISSREGVLYFDNFRLYDQRNNRVYIDFLKQQGDGAIYEIEGYFEKPRVEGLVNYQIKVSDRIYPAELTKRIQQEQSFMGEVYDSGSGFKAQITLQPGDTLSFIDDESISDEPLKITTGPFTRFGALKLTYRRDGSSLLKRTARSIEINRYTKLKHIVLETRFLFQIVINWRLRTAYDRYKKLRLRNLKQLSMRAKLLELAKPPFFIAEAVLMIPRALFLRAAYHALLLNKKKRPLWLVTDRGSAAGDNAEALFRYIKNLESVPVEVAFVLSKKSKDVDRLKSFGTVLFQESFRYKLKFLQADKIISSQADVETTNPFLRQQDHYINLFNFDFIFLQHGIIRHDLSSWLNRYNKNIRLFITSAQKEYDSIFSNPYYYPKQNVLLSGLPRYDYLNNEPKKKLILAPTYRKNLIKQKTDKNGVRRYDTTFKNSEYRKFYNNFMNDNRLVQALKNGGMNGEFYLHPNFGAQSADFDENDSFKVMDYPYDYKTAFKEGEVLVSDHSSVVFDFAYLKKPVAYAHFDVDTFFDGHSYDKSNFFSDENDGFGPVYYDYDSLVDGVVGTIEQGLGMDTKYQERVDTFFYKVDTHNSQRVYEAILEIDK